MTEVAREGFVEQAYGRKVWAWFLKIEKKCFLIQNHTLLQVRADASDILSFFHKDVSIVP